jgi:hypothetical protein
MTIVDIVNATIITIDNPTNGGLLNRSCTRNQIYKLGVMSEFEFAFKAGTYGTTGQVRSSIRFTLEANLST